VILAKTGISTVPTSAITGDIAALPAFKAAITGFSLYADLDDPEKATSVQLTGHAYAAGKKEEAPVTVLLKAAVSDMENAYDDTAGRTNTNARIDLGAGILGGALPVPGGPSDPLTPGLYNFTTDVHLTGNLHFDSQGDPDAVFIIQIAKNLLQDANYKVILSGLLAGRGYGHGWRRSAHGGPPFGQDRGYVRNWFLLERPYLHAGGVRPPDGNDLRCWGSVRLIL
jgi:hypothetical protein